MRAKPYAGALSARIEAPGPAALALLLLAACGSEPEPPPAPDPIDRNVAAPAIQRPEPSPAPKLAKKSDESGGATEVLRRYYALLDGRRYVEAFKLREANGTSEEAFAAHFDRFASQKVTIGNPSRPVEADGWLYVEVPVQTYGTMKDGTPFGSAGTVTLRTRTTESHWRIYTK